MKLNKENLQQLKKALAVCKIGGLTTVVFHNGMIMGLGERKHSAIFMPYEIGLPPDVALGVGNVSELQKRIELFENGEMELDVNDSKVVRKMTLKGGIGKIDFRCTDPKHIRYPKTNNDVGLVDIYMTKEELSLISRGMRVVKAEHITFQVKRDGGVHVEALDENNDKFELDLQNEADFDGGDSFPSVNSYDSSSNGVFMSILEAADVDDKGGVAITLTRANQFQIRVGDMVLLALPRIQLD